MNSLGQFILISLCLCGVLGKETLIFQDDFNTFDLKTWSHELTLAGGGNWEFQWYVNNRSNSWVNNSILHLKATLTEDAIGLQNVISGSVNIWGGAPADMCTGNQFYGCERNAAASGNYINPVRSARIRTVNSFSFKYGRVEVRAKMPRGDWLWPAIWLLPKYNEYGIWPTSGEIDLVESRGNDESYPAGGVNKFGSTLHWGLDFATNKFEQTHKEYTHTKSLSDDFHIYGLYWDENRLYTYFDTQTNIVLDVDMKSSSFWQKGNFGPNYDNPWVNEPNSAPFNREFYLIINLAVGGTANYFPDGQGNQPWANNDPHSVNAFYSAKNMWHSTWQGESSHLQVDSVKVWSFSSTGEEQEVQVQ